MNNYPGLVERIARSAGVTSEEIERRVEAKRAKLSGLVSKEGAAQIVAAELGVIFDKERIKLNELVEGMKRVLTIGKVTEVGQIRSFNKNGREGKVANLLIGDETSNVRTVLWDANHISLVENGKISAGSVIEISNGSVRNGELHLGSFSDIKLSSEKLGEVKNVRQFSEVALKDARIGQSGQIRAIVVQAFEPRYFASKTNGEQQALVNLVLDDGTETIRAVVAGERLIQLGFDNEEIFDVEKFKVKRDKILGDEMVFYGNFKNNAYFNRIEFSIDRTEQIDIEKLVSQLEGKDKV